MKLLVMVLILATLGCREAQRFTVEQGVAAPSVRGCCTDPGGVPAPPKTVERAVNPTGMTGDNMAEAWSSKCVAVSYGIERFGTKILWDGTPVPVLCHCSGCGGE